VRIVRNTATHLPHIRAKKRDYIAIVDDQSTIRFPRSERSSDNFPGKRESWLTKLFCAKEWLNNICVIALWWDHDFCTCFSFIDPFCSLNRAYLKIYLSRHLRSHYLIIKIRIVLKLKEIYADAILCKWKVCTIRYWVVLLENKCFSNQWTVLFQLDQWYCWVVLRKHKIAFPLPLSCTIISSDKSNGGSLRNLLVLIFEKTFNGYQCL